MKKHTDWANGEIVDGRELAAFLGWLREESILLVDNEEHNKIINGYLKYKRRDQQEWLSARIAATV